MRQKRMWQVSNVLAIYFTSLLSLHSCVDKYYLVYWGDEEDSVTAVPVTSVENGVVGEIKQVKLGKNTYEGKLIALGEWCDHSWMYDHLTKHILCESDLYQFCALHLK